MNPGNEGKGHGDSFAVRPLAASFDLICSECYMWQCSTHHFILKFILILGFFGLQ